MTTSARAPSLVLVLALVVVASAACAPVATTADTGAIATGTAPNDVALVRCGGVRTALVAASADARVDVLGLDDATAPRAVFLGAGSNPWSVAATAQGRAVVALFDASEVVLIDGCAAAVLDRARADVVFDVEPISVPTPVDGDGDGAPETTITRLRPRAPQAAVVVDDVAFVTYTNVLSYAFGDAPMVTGPGVLARFALQGDRLVFDRAALLPCENPQGVVAGDDDDVIVSCTGRFAVDGGAHRRASPGGLVRVARHDLAVRLATRLDASPGTPAVVDVDGAGDIVVGDVLDARVMLFDRALAPLRETAPAAGVDSVFVVVVDDASRPVAARFGSGEVLVDPFGARDVLPLQPQGPSRGLIDVVVDGNDVFGLFSLSGELVRAELP